MFRNPNKYHCASREAPAWKTQPAAGFHVSTFPKQNEGSSMGQSLAIRRRHAVLRARAGAESGCCKIEVYRTDNAQ